MSDDHKQHYCTAPGELLSNAKMEREATTTAEPSTITPTCSAEFYGREKITFGSASARAWASTASRP